MATNKVDINSPLKRQGWLKDRLLLSKEQSFWAPFSGRDSDAIIYSLTRPGAHTGHKVTFDYTGMNSAKAIAGDDRVYGKGKTKRKFSDGLVVEENSYTIDNGRKFDGVDVDDLNASQHGSSIGDLGNNWVVSKDQFIFDLAQGAIGTEPTHIIDLGTTFNYDSLLDIEIAGKTGKGMFKADTEGFVTTNKAKRRAPLHGWRRTLGDEDGRDNGAKASRGRYLCLIDGYMAAKLKKDKNYQTIIITADSRGNGNRAIEMYVGSLGMVTYVEAGDFFGVTGGKGTFKFESSEVDYAGLRKFARLADGTKAWEGQAKFEALELDNLPAGVEVYSRGLLLGGGAMKYLMGKAPDYFYRPEPFDGKESESRMDVWHNAGKTKLTLENGEDSEAAPVAEMDFSIIAIDMKHA